ncbi:MAG TPA: hypothetical protein VNG12_16510 [Acidimicrobiales bacterium]|nr:hypothetical protein [Acidimicrobiales bacterium]
MTRRPKAVGLAVVAIVVVAALVAWLLVVSPSAVFGHSRATPTLSDPMLTLAQASNLEARSRAVNSGLPSDLSSLAAPMEALVSSASSLPTKPGAGTAGQLAALSDAAIKMTGQLNPLQGQLPAAALAAQQRDLPSGELAAEQSSVDSFESQFASDQAELNLLQAMAASIPTVSSVSAAGDGATLDSYITTSASTPAVIASLISIAHQVEGPAQQLLVLFRQIAQRNLLGAAGSAYTAEEKMITLVNELDSDAYTIRVDVGTMLTDFANAAKSNPITLGVSTATSGTGPAELEAKVYGRACSGNVVFCWTIDNGPLAASILGYINLAASVISGLSIFVLVVSLGVTAPVTIILDGIAAITAVDQLDVDSYRIDYNTPVDKVLQLASDVIGVAFSFFGLGAIGDELKVARSEADIKNVEGQIDFIKSLQKDFKDLDQLPFATKLKELAQDKAALEEAKSLPEERNTVKSLFGLVTSISDAYTGPLAKPIQSTVNSIWTDIYHDLFPTKPAVPMVWQTRPGVLSYPADGNPTSVSCNTRDSCDVVTDSGYEVTVGSTGASTPSQIDPTANGGLDSVSCSTDGDCAAVDGAGKVALHIFAADSPQWTSPDLIDPHTSAPVSARSRAVSCSVIGDFCMLVDSSGYVYTYDNNDGKWSSLGEPDPNSKGFWSVSCPTFQFCAATELDGAIITYNGHTWSSPDELEHDSRISAVSCPTATFCAAVDQQGDAFTYNGHIWTDQPFIDTGTTQSGQPAGFESVSCPTSTFCEAVDNLGRVVSYQGSSWGHPTLIDTYAGTGGAAEYISCSSTSFCVLADGTGNVAVRAPATTKQPPPPPPPLTTTTTTPGPSWASSLGAGVTVMPPGSTPSPGNGSPGAVVEAEVADVNAGNLAAACGLLDPSAQAACTQATTGQSSSGVSYQNLGLGYIAIDGDDALVGTVGTFCSPNNSPTCVTNSDPAAIFSSGQTFATLYNAAVAAANSSSINYSLAPCIKIGSAWYLNESG